ncbi:EAL domain-containing protein [Azoarcus sp. DN11]|uniref:EAL domain-containing protein n=1 Tax=Azoarcus sp. DN11 TaxID=356837 RepID=UPI00257016B0|nr:EAL domain-containing protein [Azoarcus sp. DN11]
MEDRVSALDTIKIDQSFVIAMTDKAASVAIVQLTIELGHRLQLEIVAEGVENRIGLEPSHPTWL